MRERTTAETIEAIFARVRLTWAPPPDPPPSKAKRTKAAKLLRFKTARRVHA